MCFSLPATVLKSGTICFSFDNLNLNQYALVTSTLAFQLTICAKKIDATTDLKETCAEDQKWDGAKEIALSSKDTGAETLQEKNPRRL